MSGQRIIGVRETSLNRRFHQGRGLNGQPKRRNGLAALTTAERRVEIMGCGMIDPAFAFHRPGPKIDTIRVPWGPPFTNYVCRVLVSKACICHTDNSGAKQIYKPVQPSPPELTDSSSDCALQAAVVAGSLATRQWVNVGSLAMFESLFPIFVILVLFVISMGA